MNELSTKDHPDWWKNIGGQNSQDSILERRSTVLNDNEVEAPNAPPAFYTCATMKGKFFPRGCRGMIETIEIYCQDAGADRLTLRYSPHPCLGPFNEVTITPLATWSWVAAVIEEMWDYDSLFIWVYECDAGTDWAYDAVLPYDGHESVDVGATWADLDIRPFIRVVYSGETPGDVPVSGIINNIPIPNISVSAKAEATAVPQGVPTDIIDIDGAGYIDYILLRIIAAANSQATYLFIYCDGAQQWIHSMLELNTWGFNDDTQPISLTQFAEDGQIILLLTEQFNFRRHLRIGVLNAAGPQTVSIWAIPHTMR